MTLAAKRGQVRPSEAEEIPGSGEKAGDVGQRVVRDAVAEQRARRCHRIVVNRRRHGLPGLHGGSRLGGLHRVSKSESRSKLNRQLQGQTQPFGDWTRTDRAE